MRLLAETRNYMGNYHVKSGVYHYYRNEFSQAVTFLGKALEDEQNLSDGDRKNARGYLTLTLRGLAEKHYAKGEKESAVAELRRAVETSPDYPDIHFRLATVLRELGRLDDAIDSYREAISRHPGYLEARVALGDCMMEAGRNREAVTALNEALELKVRSIREPFDRAAALLGRGEIEAARESFREAFPVVPKVASQHVACAVELIRQKEYQSALDELGRALEDHGKFPDLHNFRGIVLCELERFDEAVDAFKRSSELRPNHLVPRLNLAFAHARAGDLREAEAELEAILELEPTEPAALAKLAELRSGRPAEARSAARGAPR